MEEKRAANFLPKLSQYRISLSSSVREENFRLLDDMKELTEKITNADPDALEDAAELKTFIYKQVKRNTQRLAVFSDGSYPQPSLSEWNPIKTLFSWVAKIKLFPSTIH
jgi:hypothetical protein